MKNKSTIAVACVSSLVLGASQVVHAGDPTKGDPIPETLTPSVIVSTKDEPVTDGKYKPTWDSLHQYQTPDWYRDAKFGIWACFGPQCQAEQGDWYARGIYRQGGGQNKWHVANFGPPSQEGFKDVIHAWKAEKWDAGKLVTFYKRVGAQYVVVMANHHDNFDMYDSKYQPWNSVKVGPMKDIVGDFAKAAHDNNLPLGVSVHAAHAWLFYEMAQSSDTKGPLAGVPYDGKLTKADGKGTWWEGLDPQDLYAQSHLPSEGFTEGKSINRQWDWGNGASVPDAAYCQRFYNRTMDLINKYKPDLVYFDDDALPLWPVSDAGLDITAHFYNANAAWHDGKEHAVVLGKQLNEFQKHCITWDVERGSSNRIEPLPFETDTCIGHWHYERKLFDNNGYKTPGVVIHTLADIVSKNGNLLLSVPVRGDGSIDEKETAVLESIATWTKINGEAIFGTRPWKMYGEGPTKVKTGNFSEGAKFTGKDVRFTTKDGNVYALILGVPTEPLTIKALGSDAKLLDKPIASITLLGSDATVKWKEAADGVTIEPPEKAPSDLTIVYKIKF